MVVVVLAGNEAHWEEHWVRYDSISTGSPLAGTVQSSENVSVDGLSVHAEFEYVVRETLA